MTGLVLVALPPTLAVVISILSPDHFSTMLAEQAGIRMIVVGIVLQLAGALIIRKIVNIDY
jgi:tight adherence protein B